jgi:hypothetical protein
MTKSNDKHKSQGFATKLMKDGPTQSKQQHFGRVNVSFNSHVMHPPQRFDSAIVMLDSRP